MAIIIESTTMAFLKDLKKNNRRDWFEKNRVRYLAAHENMIAFADALLNEMRRHDYIETSSGNQSLFRIYRDTRFSKDKSPYKSYFAGRFRRATARLRGGYFFMIGPQQSLAAGGFFSPNPQDLLRIRKDMEWNHDEWLAMLHKNPLAKTFGTLKGEKLLTAPKGFAKDSPAIDLLRHKQFYFEKNFTDEEVLRKNFVKVINQTFQNLRSYFDYMSELLTTDTNGVSIL